MAIRVHIGGWFLVINYALHTREVSCGVFQRPTDVNTIHLQIKINFPWGVIHKLDDIELGNNSLVIFL